MPTVIKQTKLRIDGLQLTDRRWNKYSNVAIDGVVATATDNTAPTKAQMLALEKAYYRFQRLCSALGGAGITLDQVLSDTTVLAAIPTSLEIQVSYRPNAIMGLPATFDATALGVTPKPTTPAGEIEAIGVVILGSLSRAFDGATEIAQTFRGDTIEVIQVPAAVDNTVSKPYNVIQLGSAEITLDGFVAKINVTEF